jgi:hypothetical protein
LQAFTVELTRGSPQVLGEIGVIEAWWACPRNVYLVCLAIVLLCSLFVHVHIIRDLHLFILMQIMLKYAINIYINFGTCE